MKGLGERSKSRVNIKVRVKVKVRMKDKVRMESKGYTVPVPRAGNASEEQR